MASQQGEPGTPGITGATGTPGATGATGASGATGATGVAGVTGQAGAEGVPGIRGPVGPQGPEGGATPALAATLVKLAEAVDAQTAAFALQSDTLHRDRRDRKWIAVAGALVAVVLVVFGIRLNAVANTNKRNGEILLDCTTPTPTTTPGHPEVRVHECYERGGRATGAAVAELRRSTDCVGWYFAGERPRACEDVADRLDRIRAGENPFAPSTTTTTTRPR